MRWKDFLEVHSEGFDLNPGAESGFCFSFKKPLWFYLSFTDPWIFHRVWRVHFGLKYANGASTDKLATEADRWIRKIKRLESDLSDLFEENRKLQDEIRIYKTPPEERAIIRKQLEAMYGS